MANDINGGSYAQYNDFDSYSYNCIKYLMENDEVVWKLLKHLTPDGWSGANLTLAEKGALIYNGTDDTSKFQVFLDEGAPDVITREDCIIRISPHSIYPENRVYGTVSMVFEVYTNYKVNTLSNYKTRTDSIVQRFIQVFNGATIGGIGKMFFDRMGSFADRAEWVGNIPFKGRWIIMSNKSP